MKEIITVNSRIDSFDIDVFIPENWDEKNLLIFQHGFNSGKNGDSYALMGSDLLKHNIAYAIFSLPYHAERRIDKDDFTLENCIKDSEIAEDMIRAKYPNTRISILGTSFGGYLTLLKLKRQKRDYHKIILKSPAIKMAEIVKKLYPDEEFEDFKAKGYTVNNWKETPMFINYSFYEEIEKTKIMDDPIFDEHILLFHGTADDLAPYQDSKEFADLNKNTTLISLENENHSFTLDCLAKVSEKIAKEVLS